MRKYPLSCAALLPLLDLASWAALVVAPTLLLYLRLKSGVHEGSVSVGTGGTSIVIPADHLFAFALDRSTWVAHGALTLLHAPAKFVEILVSLLVSGTIQWEPERIATNLWRSLTYPLYALPAWAYVGRGLDALLGRARVSAGNMMLSAALSLLAMAIAAGLRFGLTAEERLLQDQISWYIAGFAFWAVLFAVPLVAWLLQRASAQPEA